MFADLLKSILKKCVNYLHIEGTCTSKRQKTEFLLSFFLFFFFSPSKVKAHDNARHGLKMLPSPLTLRSADSRIMEYLS